LIKVKLLITGLSKIIGSNLLNKLELIKKKFNNINEKMIKYLIKKTVYLSKGLK
jgi:hypothetical protein